MKTWYQQTADEILEKLESNEERGLSRDQASQRLEQFGPNELVERGLKSSWKILWEQLTDVMVVMLLISAAISIFLLREYKDASVILVIVVLNAILGFTQEYRAEQAMAALKRMAVPRVRVRRGGHVTEISSRELVPGDIVLIEAGGAVPADCRVLESVNLRVQESVLTGESEPVDKIAHPLEEENLAVGDQHNLLFMGTAATYGRGHAVVVETGMNTQLGKIAEMIQSVEGEQTPLQRRLGQLGKGLAAAAVVIVAVVFVLGLLRGEDFRLMFMTAISMAVAAVPEGLPAVVTIALALGAQRMLKRQALIRKLPAVETLGSVTVICTDKTGTLTENRMTVSILDVAGNSYDVKEHARDYSPYLSARQAQKPALLQQDAVTLLLIGGTLCNDAVLEPVEDEGGFSTVGDPTEGALVVAAARFGLWKKELEEAMPRVAELPFDSDRKRMSTVHRISSEKLPEVLKPAWKAHPETHPLDYIVITKGAVDSLLEVSDRIWDEGKVEDLDEDWRARIQQGNDDLAQKGMRVLGVGFRGRSKAELDEANDPLERGLVFVGMFGMIDPARPEVEEAVHTAQTAGIQPIMITGDHPLTALAIAKEIGISQGGSVITGQQLAKIEPEALQKQVEETQVYARVSPEHKLRIVEALQKRGHLVAMTGDGVNDAPALKRADIGVAMGITGTDVSKEAADMILLDDNFATIVSAVREGRRIYDNIRKFIRYTMTSNAGEIWVMLLAPFLGMPLPLTPIQILWINLVTDGLPGLALTVEKEERNTMQRAPYPPDENIFGRGMTAAILWVGLLIGLLSLGSGYFLFRSGFEHWRTVIFTTLTLAQMGNALSTRSERDTIFRLGFFSNPAMLGAVGLTFALQMAVIYLPFLQSIFDTAALSFWELVESVGLGVATFLVLEWVKWLRFRGKNAQ